MRSHGSADDVALAQLLGVPEAKIYEMRLYRALDELLPHKEKLEVFLKNRLGELFELEYDLLLYDVTSTYFEGQAKAISKAKHGYSRDKRSDCKQVCIALVVSRCGMPIGYEVFDDCLGRAQVRADRSPSEALGQPRPSSLPRRPPTLDFPRNAAKTISRRSASHPKQSQIPDTL